MSWFKKREQKKESEVKPPVDSKREQAIAIINSMLKKDIRLFFSRDEVLDALIAKLAKGELEAALSMLAMPRTEENIKNAKATSEKIKEIYG